ncbi:MAG: class E sortase [Nocardioidaceae bacterium]
MGAGRLGASIAGVAIVLAGCGASDSASTSDVAEVAPEREPASVAESPVASPPSRSEPPPSPPDATPTPATTEPRPAILSVPGIGVRDLRVVPYRGRPDDGPGTRIQNGGVAASPYGPRGGEGPGAIGNYIVTAHRTSSTRAFEFLPELRRGDLVRVDAGQWRFVYEVVETRSTSFRSERSLERQVAAVPGRARAEPTKAYITLSTCATPEDHAAGNWWADRFGNPEHRIDKIGVLVRTVPLD